MELSPGSEPVDKKPIITTDGLIQTTATTAKSEQATTSTQSVGGAGSSGNNTNLTVDQLEIDILSVIYDIVRCVEKDPLDNSTKQRESQECSQKILELEKRFESARAQIRQLPGVDYNKEEQVQNHQLLVKQLELKQQLIRKYKDTQF